MFSVSDSCLNLHAAVMLCVFNKFCHKFSYLYLKFLFHRGMNYAVTMINSILTSLSRPLSNGSA